MKKDIFPIDQINENNYHAWVKEVGDRFRKSQVRAATKVNEESLRFYWSVGRDIVLKQYTNIYGSGFFAKLSKDLKKQHPEIKSFSVTNLKYMKYFYEVYSNRQQVVDDLNMDSKRAHIDYLDDTIFKIPWGHHMKIIGKYRNDTKAALFFVRKTLENNWSRAVLMNFLETNLYERQGHAITNFQKTLPEVGSDLAKEITKDPYNFDFLTLQEGYNEKELKRALMNNVQDFLMELGRGFAFVGREYRLVVGKTEQYIDLLFYSIKNHCYVVVEVKVTDFEPRDMGQLATYVAIVDDMIREKNDNATVGLLICKTKDNVLAKYAVNAMNVPIGISEYELNKLIPEQLKGTMPTIEEIESELQ